MASPRPRPPIYRRAARCRRCGSFWNVPSAQGRSPANRAGGLPFARPRDWPGGAAAAPTESTERPSGVAYRSRQAAKSSGIPRGEARRTAPFAITRPSVDRSIDRREEAYERDIPRPRSSDFRSAVHGGGGGEERGHSREQFLETTGALARPEDEDPIVTETRGPEIPRRRRRHRWTDRGKETTSRSFLVFPGGARSSRETVVNYVIRVSERHFGRRRCLASWARPIESHDYEPDRVMTHDHDRQPVIVVTSGKFRRAPARHRKIARKFQLQIDEIVRASNFPRRGRRKEIYP